MSNENKPDAPQIPDTNTPPPGAAPCGTGGKKKLSLDIEEVDVSEVLERKISA